MHMLYQTGVGLVVSIRNYLQPNLFHSMIQIAPMGKALLVKTGMVLRISSRLSFEMTLLRKYRAKSLAPDKVLIF